MMLFTWRSVLLLLILAILPVSCQQVTTTQLPSENGAENISQTQPLTVSTENITLESGFEIPHGTMPQREATYDDIIRTPGGTFSYRGNILETGKISELESVKHIKVLLDGGFYVSYRNVIETKARQIRTILFFTSHPGIDMTNYLIKIKQSNLLEGIQVKQIEQLTWLSDAIAFMVEISPQIKPGDYKLGFLMFVNGEYFGDLPCNIHIIE